MPLGVMPRGADSSLRFCIFRVGGPELFFAKVLDPRFDVSGTGSSGSLVPKRERRTLSLSAILFLLKASYSDTSSAASSISNWFNT
jgi:hypothetical protein